MLNKWYLCISKNNSITKTLKMKTMRFPIKKRMIRLPVGSWGRAYCDNQYFYNHEEG